MSGSDDDSDEDTECLVLDAGRFHFRIGVAGEDHPVHLPTARGGGSPIERTGAPIGCMWRGAGTHGYILLAHSITQTRLVVVVWGRGVAA